MQNRITANRKITETGRMGADDKKYTTLSSGGTVFYILGGITMITSIVIAVKNKD